MKPGMQVRHDTGRRDIPHRFLLLLFFFSGLPHVIVLYEFVTYLSIRRGVFKGPPQRFTLRPVFP